MPDHATKTDGAWRVMRFEDASGRYAEVASNEVGPEAIPVPPGYRFVSSFAMVRAEVTDEMVERAAQELYNLRPDIEVAGPTWISDPMADEWGEWAHRVLAAALRQEGQRDG